MNNHPDLVKFRDLDLRYGGELDQLQRPDLLRLIREAVTTDFERDLCLYLLRVNAGVVPAGFVRLRLLCRLEKQG